MQPPAEITQSPADNTMHRRDGSFFEPGFQGRQHLLCQAGFLSPAMTIHKAIRAIRIETQHPVTDTLTVCPRKQGRLAARGAIINRRKRQQATRLTRMPASARKASQLRTIMIVTQG
ncbi:hypothetical protein H845_3463 (plasmid) [Komagataeibacter xylinus E25]|nr:hypothetical protein H845_3463 [Komagataeibacter xylinus E25]RFP04528.1 hypothetical protein BFX83_07440 [Komagataeibacter xylinus]